MLDHQGHISIPATVARGPVYVSSVILYPLAYDATDVLDNHNLEIALSAQIQITIAMIGMVRRPSVEPIFLAKIWNSTSEKVQKTIETTVQRRIRTMLYSLLLR